MQVLLMVWLENNICLLEKAAWLNVNRCLYCFNKNRITMKNTLFILSLIIWCSCSSEIPFDADRAEDIVATRTANLDEYSFEIYGGALSSYYQYDCRGNLEKVMPAIVSFHRGNNHIIISVRELYLNYPILLLPQLIP